MGKPLLVLWIIVTIVSLTTMPNMDHLTKEKGQITVQILNKCAVAKEMIKQMDKKGAAKRMAL
ncbi:hypothetical protein [Peribacillus simplex]|uniref:hypothetical protein n=1 Tax=Peribacillus simplex TaxID=1478 RepID=UPI0025A2E39E|nr:hypothetical protein [Peribacillus simplex]